jgi:Gluconate 2-dehydrogenase subunit 3
MSTVGGETRAITRRDAMSAIASAVAVAGAPEFLNGWLRGAEVYTHGAENIAPPEPDQWNNYEPKFFSREEMQLLDAFTAILIPTDETPGAREAHVVPFIDFVVNAAAEFEPELQQEWHGSVRHLGEHEFGNLSGAQQVEFVEKISHGGVDGHATYELIKDMTVHAFYTSRVGLIEVLEYKGNAYLTEFPGCSHPEHRQV